MFDSALVDSENNVFSMNPKEEKVRMGKGWDFSLCNVLVSIFFIMLSLLQYMTGPSLKIMFSTTVKCETDVFLKIRISATF